MEKFYQEVLMNGIKDMVFILKVVNNDFRFQFINTAAMKRLNLSNQIIGSSIMDIEPKEKAIFLYKQYSKVVESQKSYTYEDVYEENGKKYYAETDLSPFYDEKGKVDRIIAVVRDITHERNALSDAMEMISGLAESNERYHSLFFHNTDGIFILNKMGYITDGNEATEHITGYKIKELFGKPLKELLDKEDTGNFDNLISEALKGTNQSGDLIFKNKNGEQINIIFKIIPLLIDEKIIGLYGILKDITEQLQSINKLEESEKRFRIIAENAHDLITLVNKDGEITYVSPSYKNILGYYHQEYLKKSFLHNVHTDDQERLVETVRNSISSGEPFTIQFRQKNAKGDMIWCESIGNPVFNQKNTFQHLVVLTRDITLRREYESKLKYFAYHDSLSDLPNRLFFKEQFAFAKEQFLTNNTPLALILLDIDHFKLINDTYGHDTGDAVIKEFGFRIKSTIRDHDMVARLGGDEFVILLSNIQSYNAIEIAERINHAIQQPWKLNGHTLTVTTSMGIATASSQLNFTESSLIKKADIALYEAKESGKNCYKLYNGNSPNPSSYTNKKTKL
ncbi:sensor domain-containing diguanylate cyclase [Solibacillus sp. NPDC093137]|uniref:sensor domain-containing diguanylate cyclase n=1 Tax=Solibacillus sp. NPDC093137 TaxID=3390678 RepID=UPI003CFC368F